MRVLFGGCSLLGLLLLAPALAVAQAATLNRYRAASGPSDDFALARQGNLAHLQVGAQLQFDYAHDPLVFESVAGDSATERFAVVEHQLSMNAALSLGLFDRVMVSIGLPVVMVMRGDAESTRARMGLVPADDTGLGDVYVGARVLIWNTETFALAAQARLSFPSAGADATYRGDTGVVVHPEVLAEGSVGPVRLVGNLGFRVRSDTGQLPFDRQFSDELTLGLGAAIAVVESQDEASRVEALVQTYGDFAVHDFFGRNGSALELLAGLKLTHRTGITASLGVGPGLLRGLGGPDVRVVGTLGFARRPGGAAGADDGRSDSSAETSPSDERRPAQTDDSPQDETEVPNPEPVVDCRTQDADTDGVNDCDDGCPAQAEDADGYQDADGCPDPDNDSDGVLDVEDACPDQVGVESARGCPDPDRDGDGVVDRLDNCPDQAGSADHRGCQSQQRVVLENDRLRILDMVYFRLNRATIQRRSFPLLENVAQVLRAHPELEHIRVEGHTDNRGDAEYNRRLSQGRADAVVRWLVEHGVEDNRLVAVGFGPDRPRIENASTEDEHAQNRRVEFRIVSEADQP